MEYVEGGTLTQVMKDKKKNNTWFTEKECV